jgi:hypothetical protein
VTFENTLKWNVQVANITGKANKILGMLRRAIGNSSAKTSMLCFNCIARPILEYASQVWSPHNQNLIKSIEMIQNRAIRWAYRLDRMDSISEALLNNDIISLSERRRHLDGIFLGKVECGHYDIELRDYIRFNREHNTRHQTINPHYSVNAFKYSFYNRMREHVKLRYLLTD